MTQTATSKRGQGVVIHADPLPNEGERVYAVGKAAVTLWLDGAYVGDRDTASAARAKAAELTDDVGLIWETRP